jgi:hypothetical protein
MQPQSAYPMPTVNPDSSSINKLGPKPGRSRAEGNGGHSYTSAPLRPLQENGNKNTEQTQQFSRC